MEHFRERRRRAARRWGAVVLGLGGMGLTDAAGLARTPRSRCQPGSGRRPTGQCSRPRSDPASWMANGQSRLARANSARASSAAKGRTARRRRPPTGCSGIIVDADQGRILTIDHGVRGASQVLVIFLAAGSDRPARSGHDPRSDLALPGRGTPGLGLTQVSWGDANTPRAGMGACLGPAGRLRADDFRGDLSERRRIGGDR